MTIMSSILVLTPTLGNRKSLLRTIESVKEIGRDEVKHVIVCPQQMIPHLSRLSEGVEFLAEPEGKKGIYAALNHGFHTYGKNYDYLTFINDDDYWLPDFRQLIDAVVQDDSLGMVYAKTIYIDAVGKVIGKQASSGQFDHFLELFQRGIILLTQQATLVKSSHFFEIGGFDETYKLVADTKFWIQMSLLKPHFRYFRTYAACYTLQKSQLSNDKTTQQIEHRRLLLEFPVYSSIGIRMQEVIYRLSNLTIYVERVWNSLFWKQAYLSAKKYQRL
ncbi:glycosyltransferase [Bacteroidales bacterium SW292]|nr:glycosyltransferase [Bacteroidales bacterium SW292]